MAYNKSRVLHLLELANVPIWEQLLIEEAYLRTETKNICIVNRGSLPAIVMGISAKKENAINEDKAREKKIPIIKRFSGGGTVVVDDNTLFVTFIFNKDVSNSICTPNAIHQYVFPFLDFATGKVPSKLIENDYVIENKKFGGNAQYLSKDRWLHHSSLLWDFDHDKMELLKYPVKVPKYRGKRSHMDFLCCLKDFMPTKDVFFNNLTQGLKETFEVKLECPQRAFFLKNKDYRKATKIL